MQPFGSGPVLMGVVNVTPDSFSDGGAFLSAQKAIDHGYRLIDEGAEILDIGGESTRPGAAPVSIQEEQGRILPVIEGLKDAGVMLSVDTRHAATMRAALQAGAQMINDITALGGDSESMAVAASAHGPVCLMHMQGEPQTMQRAPSYENAVRDVFDFLAGRIEECEKAGIEKSRIIADVGIGFGKALDHNLSLIRNVSQFHDLGVPLLVGLSRKSFIDKICAGFMPDHDPVNRVPGSLAAALWCLQQGVQFFRVHDVAQTRQAFAVLQAIAAAPENRPEA